MDSSFTIRPRDAVTRIGAGRSNIVRTDLSPSQSVNAASHASGSHTSPDTLTRDPSIDPQCQSVLDREREERERRKRARRDEAMLRQKAYDRPAEAPETAPDDLPHADLQV